MTHIPTSTGPTYTERCTPEERRILDAFNDTDHPSGLADQLAIIDARQAVINAAIDETKAEADAVDAVGRAFTAATRSTRIAAANDATRAAQAARVQRREAVAKLEQFERSAPT